MHGFVPTWSTITQCLAAGVVVGLCALHWGWWRGDLRRTGAGWTLVWSVALAAVLLVNGLLAVVPPDAAEPLLFLRFAARASAVVLSLPAIHAYTGGPPVRRLVTALTGWYAVAGVLWVGTDLVHVHAVQGLPVYGPLATALDLLPVVVVGLYLVRNLRGRPLNRVGAVVTVAGAVSSVLLIASSVPPPTTTSEILRGAWVVPLSIGLQVLAAARISAVRREALRREEMRDALTALSNAAWYVRSPELLLEQGRDRCREVLADDSIEGTMRQLGRDRFVTEFWSPGSRQADDEERQFLSDMARLVSTAAERHRLTNRLARAALTDSLTQLDNRLAAEDALPRLLADARSAGREIAVLLCDLEGFRAANERHGHPWGDRMLLLAADHLRRTAGPDALVARYGADEFLLVVRDVDALALADRLRAELPSQLAGAVVPGLSVGIALAEPGLDAFALLHRAEEAIREAQQAGVGVVVHDAALRSRLGARAALRRALEDGLRRREVVARYQPVSDAVTGEIVGLEVLARWRRDGRLLPPSEWLPFAEESGLIVQVGQEMLRSARGGMERFGLPVAVNVAARQLAEPDFVRHVEEAWGDDAWDRLTLEITESALLDDAAHVRTALTVLADRGVRIAIDDFGTGYNSLARLGALPLHVLKIDRAFVRDMATPEGAAVLRAIIALAQAHALDVVAEGVERADQLEALRAMGVGKVQGHFVGRPAARVPGTRERLARVPAARASGEAPDGVRPAASV